MMDTEKRLTHVQATLILALVDMLLERVDDLTEDEKRYLTFAKSGSFAVLGQDQ